MKTSHDLALELLSGPDVPVAIYTIEKDQPAPVPHEPKALFLQGQTGDGDDSEVVEIYGTEPVVGMASDEPMRAGAEVETPEMDDPDISELKRAEVSFSDKACIEPGISFIVSMPGKESGTEVVLTVNQLLQLAAWACGR